MARTPSPMRPGLGHHAFRAAGGIVAVYAAWLAFMAVHESGHVLHAWVSGGSVERVMVPLIGFSRTDLRVNPRPLFVVWGGPIWGCLIPAALVPLGRWIPRLRTPLLAFAGFCLIANGVYIALGAPMQAGDAGDMLRYGSPRWLLWAFGGVTVPLGFYAWHRLGSIGALLRPPKPAQVGSATMEERTKRE
jgi:hypothetical protein